MIYVNFILIMTIIVAITAVVISLMYAVTKSFIVDLKKYFKLPSKSSKETVFSSFMVFCVILTMTLIYALTILNYNTIFDNQPDVKRISREKEIY